MNIVPLIVGIYNSAGITGLSSLFFTFSNQTQICILTKLYSVTQLFVVRYVVAEFSDLNIQLTLIELLLHFVHFILSDIHLATQ